MQEAPLPIVELMADGPETDTHLARARAFAEPLLAGRHFDTEEDALEHADGVAEILRAMGAAPSLRAAVYLVYAGEFLSDPEDVVTQAFGASYGHLVSYTRKLVQVQRHARGVMADAPGAQGQTDQLELVRKMLLAFSRDLRVVLLRLASRLQTLRHYAATKKPCPPMLAREAQQIFAPLANRLGIWQIKWEMEDLAFRFLEPEQYKRIASLLDEKRVERESRIEAVRQQLTETLAHVGIRAQVHGRPKHIYSIWKKMRGKKLEFARVLDVSALRVIVSSVDECYAALGRVHERWQPLPDEFDDYIARPKSNGYQSLHTVVLTDSGVEGAAAVPVEIQIRTLAMHEHAESGVAAHWAYKEAGTKGYAGVSAAGDFEDRVALARRAVLHQLLAWERDAVQAVAETIPAQGLFEDRIYVFTPQGNIVELTAGATPIDFAYSLHTDLGHRCRGAKVDGVMVPLQTALQSGQTVEVSAIKEGGPSMDWLNPQLGYLRSARARTKVRAWFNARAQQETIARGRDAVERLLQREGRTALKLEALAEQLGFEHADALFEKVGKDEYPLRNIENLLRPPAPPEADKEVLIRRSRVGDGASAGAGVLVVGVPSLMTQLARCCRPAPPDPIRGYVTRGKGVAVHRADCPSFRQMALQAAERVLAVTWDGEDHVADGMLYPVNVSILAADRQGLLRDISEVFTKEKMNVTGVHTQSVKGTAWMTFTVEVADAARLTAVLNHVAQVPGVQSARRK
jgi:GTP pyrophosphokinase